MSRTSCDWWSPGGTCAGVPTMNGASRSEEHTSELQSQSNLVCRLLLEKKKKKARISSTSFIRLSICLCMPSIGELELVDMPPATIPCLRASLLSTSQASSLQSYVYGDH